MLCYLISKYVFLKKQFSLLNYIDTQAKILMIDIHQTLLIISLSTWSPIGPVCRSSDILCEYYTR